MYSVGLSSQSFFLFTERSALAVFPNFPDLACRSNIDIHVSYGCYRPGGRDSRLGQRHRGLAIKASVSLRDPSGLTTTVTTDESGHFAFEGLTPGAYTIVAACDGFRAEPRAITVTSTVVDVALTLPMSLSTEVDGSTPNSSRLQPPVLSSATTISVIVADMSYQYADGGVA